MSNPIPPPTEDDDDFGYEAPLNLTRLDLVSAELYEKEKARADAAETKLAALEKKIGDSPIGWVRFYNGGPEAFRFVDPPTPGFRCVRLVEWPES